MPLPKSSEASALADTAGAGASDAPAPVVAGSKDEWFLLNGRYPLIDAYNGTKFEQGIRTKAERTKWVDKMIGLGALMETDAPPGSGDAPGA